MLYIFTYVIYIHIYIYIHPPVLKHGNGNGPFMSDFPQKKSIQFGDFPCAAINQLQDVWMADGRHYFRRAGGLGCDCSPRIDFIFRETYLSMDPNTEYLALTYFTILLYLLFLSTENTY